VDCGVEVAMSDKLQLVVVSPKLRPQMDTDETDQNVRCASVLIVSNLFRY
jgi:hypothetical protein